MPTRSEGLRGMFLQIAAGSLAWYWWDYRFGVLWLVGSSYLAYVVKCHSAFVSDSREISRKGWF